MKPRRFPATERAFPPTETEKLNAGYSHIFECRANAPWTAAAREAHEQEFPQKTVLVSHHETVILRQWPGYCQRQCCHCRLVWTEEYVDPAEFSRAIRGEFLTPEELEAKQKDDQARRTEAMRIYRTRKRAEKERVEKESNL